MTQAKLPHAHFARTAHGTHCVPTRRPAPAPDTPRSRRCSTRRISTRSNVRCWSRLCIRRGRMPRVARADERRGWLEGWRTLAAPGAGSSRRRSARAPRAARRGGRPTRARLGGERDTLEEPRSGVELGRADVRSGERAALGAVGGGGADRRGGCAAPTALWSAGDQAAVGQPRRRSRRRRWPPTLHWLPRRAVEAPRWAASRRVAEFAHAAVSEQRGRGRTRSSASPPRPLGVARGCLLRARERHAGVGAAHGSSATRDPQGATQIRRRGAAPSTRSPRRSCRCPVPAPRVWASSRAAFVPIAPTAPTPACFGLDGAERHVASLEWPRRSRGMTVADQAVPLFEHARRLRS